MPNHVKNELTFDCSKDRALEIMSEIMYSPDSDNESTGIGTFDFNTIIHMPEELNIECGSSSHNAIQIYLTAVNPDTPDYCFEKLSREEFSQLVRDLNGEGAFFAKYETNIGSESMPRYLGGSSFDKVSHFGEKIVEAFKKYGATCWYYWCIKNWGTKWNSYDNYKPDDKVIYFNTAWSPPTPVIDALAGKYRDVHIIHRWADEDIGVNCGRREYENGVLFDDYEPVGNKDAIDLALDVWGGSPEDHDLVLNKSGTDYINMYQGDFEVVELLGQVALFSERRLSDDDIPENLYAYYLRHGDNGKIVTLEPKVIVNHAGTILTTKPIDFGDKGYIAFDEENYPNFTGERESFYEYLGR